MRIVTWNVNSLNARLPRVLEFLAEHAPDALCLQETKCEPEAFPTEALAEAGYVAHHHSAGRWAGVAILAALHEAREIVQRRWEDVLRVAAAVEQGDLDGDDLTRLLGPSPAPRWRASTDMSRRMVDVEPEVIDACGLALLPALPFGIVCWPGPTSYTFHVGWLDADGVATFSTCTRIG